MPGEGTSEESGLRVVLLSGSYGYSGRLLYFAQVFGELVRRFPAAAIHVDQHFPVADHPHLPLRPILRFHVVKRNRTVNGIEYRRVIRVPALANVRRLLSLRADVIAVIEFTPTAALGFLVSRLAHVPLALLIESDPSYRSGGTTGGLRARLTVTVKRYLVRRADAVLVSNEIGRRYVTDRLAVPTDKLVVGPYLTSAPARALPLPGGAETRFLFLNSLTKRKGAAEFLRALSALPVELKGRWAATVVGDGPERPNLERMVVDLGLVDRVRFLGARPYETLEQDYADSSVVVSPSLVDYRSLSGFEAVNAGRGLIASIHDGAHEELLRLAPAVRAVDPRNTEEFAAALASFISDPDTLRSELLAGPPPEFSVAAVGANLEEVLRLALARAQR
jgi:glycosyltransferase involved in cell wall biosynthesis